MQTAVGPAPLLGHPSSKQEPINFSRFQDVISQVGSYIFPCHYKGHVLSHEQIREGIDISGTIKHFSQNKFENKRIFCRNIFFVVGFRLFYFVSMLISPNFITDAAS